MTPYVCFEAVSCRLGGRTVLENFSLAVFPEDRFVLLGRSGSGKTTALRLINALLWPSAGRVLVAGRPTSEWDLVRLRRGIGYVLQSGGLLPHLTVAENIGLLPRLEGWERERMMHRTGELMRLIGLQPEEFATRYPRQISGGQQQRVALARALALSPPLLLLDEPFAALDPMTRLSLQKEFVALCRAQKTTAVFVTHDVTEALRVGTRIGVMARGRMETAGTPEEFLRARTGEAAELLRTLAARLE